MTFSEIINKAQPWIEIINTPPPDGLVVETCIDDCQGCRNQQKLKRHGNLWLLPDGSMYVNYAPTYYVPTHWRSLGIPTCL